MAAQVVTAPLAGEEATAARTARVAEVVILAEASVEEAKAEEAGK